MDYAKIKDLAIQSGMCEADFLDTEVLICHEEVRIICEDNVCHNYNTTWACPPAIGTLEECRKRLSMYHKMLLFSGCYTISDSFDLEGMQHSMKEFKYMVDRFQQKIQPFLQNYLLLSNEGCGKCQVCTYPGSPCRFPEKLNHSIEGYGLIISELAKQAGIRYNNGKNTVTFFGGLLI